jgi:hypothetical protein
MLYYILRFGPHPTRALGRRTSCPPLRAGTPSSLKAWQQLPTLRTWWDPRRPWSSSAAPTTAWWAHAASSTWNRLRSMRGLCMHVRCCFNNKYWVPQQCVLHGGSACWVIRTTMSWRKSCPSRRAPYTSSSPSPTSKVEDGSTRSFTYYVSYIHYSCAN